jgi:HD-like signal output (HDOD) protein
MIADRLYSNGIVKTEKSLQFNDYWIGALLHDIGKIVLGFFFWDHYEAILRQMSENQSSFREAEKELGDAANHEYLGRLLLVKSNVGKELADAVGAHDSVGKAPGDLVCLIHMANNVSKELNLGYLPEEEPKYNAQVLAALNLDQKRAGELKQHLGSEMAAEIAEVVDHCTNPH